MRNNFFVGIILSVSICFVSGQGLNFSNCFTNDSARFTIWFVQPDWEKDQFYSETIVQVTSLDSIDWKESKSLNKETWLSLLNNPRFDWIANLALYEFTENMPVYSE
jgi:hypothetical protein